MGKLVIFDKRGRTPRERPAQSGDAQIYLFTGVRYERDGRDGAPLPNKPAGSSRAKRKRV